MDDFFTEILQNINTKMDTLMSTQARLDDAIQLNNLARNYLLSSLNEAALQVSNDGLDCSSFNERINEIISAVHESENNACFARNQVDPT